MDIKIANELIEAGVFSQLYKAGLISDKLFVYREIYLWVNAQVQTRHISNKKAAIEASIKFNKDERTIYRALSCFTSDKPVSEAS